MPHNEETLDRSLCLSIYISQDRLEYFSVRNKAENFIGLRLQSLFFAHISFSLWVSWRSDSSYPHSGIKAGIAARMWKFASCSWGGLSNNATFFLEVTYITSAHNSSIGTSYLALPKQNGKYSHSIHQEGEGPEAFQEQYCWPSCGTTPTSTRKQFCTFWDPIFPSHIQSLIFFSTF